MSKVLFDHRLSVGVTDKMNALLEDIAIARTRRGSPISKSDIIREAIRLYLDEQADARGSRKQIAKSLEGQMESLTTEVENLHQQMAELSGQLATQQELILRLGRALQPVIDRVTPRPKA